jgi:anti-sigma regulatory factor (Ser/Thr protein kinase)
MAETRPGQDPDDEGAPEHGPEYSLRPDREHEPDQVYGSSQAHGSGGVNGAPRRPLSDSLPLGSLDGAVPSARLHARHVLWEWGLESLAPNVELVVSELVTNAVQATQRAELDTPVRLSLLADEGRVLVVVGDAVDEPPRLRRPDTTDEGGRGLVVVDSFCEWWDWKPARGGKLVRALVSAG